jgi:ketosteroid isomerase-like protein
MLMKIALILLAVLLPVAPLTAGAQGSADDEAAVKKVIDDVSKAFNRDDLATVLTHLADDAQIDSKIAGGKVSKPKYAEVVAASIRQGNVLSSQYSGVRVVLSDATHATALGTLYVTTKTNRLSWPHEWKLEKRDARWLIVETNFR